MQEIMMQEIMGLGSGLLIGAILSLTIWVLNFLKSSKFDLVASSTVASLWIFLWSVKQILGVGLIHADIHDIIRIAITTILGAGLTGLLLLPSVGKQLFNFDFQQGWYNDKQITKIIKSASLTPKEITDNYAQMAWNSLRALARSRGVVGVNKLKKTEILLELLIKDLS